MDVLSFTTIILMLFIIIGSYLIFTSQIEGRAKTIIIIAVFICFIYIFMNLNLFKSYTESKSSPVDAMTPQTVTNVDTTSTSFSLSTWIYITDWNSGMNKTIFSMTNEVVTTYSPKIILGPYNNDLVITYYTTPTTTQNAEWGELNTLLTTYNTAKRNWIAASNAERDATTGFNFVSITGSGASAIGTTPNTGGLISTLVNTTLRNNTNIAYTALKNARTAYDGGTTGINGKSTDTTYVETDDAGATYNTRLTRSVSTDGAFVPATVIDDILTNTLTGGGISTYNAGKDDQLSAWDAATSTDEFSKETINIKEISIQKWVNIVISFGDNTVDTYINGKLVDSHVSTGSVQHVSNVASDSTLTWGGFTGYISSSRYYPTFLSPQEVWTIYKAGFSDNLLGNFLNQYNAKFTFSQNQVEKASFNIL